MQTINDLFKDEPKTRHFKRDTNYFAIAGINPGYTHLAPTTVEVRNILKNLTGNPQEFYNLQDRLNLVDPHSINEFTTRKNSVSKISFQTKSRESEEDKRIEMAQKDLQPIFKEATKVIQESLLMGIKPREIQWDDSGSRVKPVQLLPLRKDQFFWKGGELLYSPNPGFAVKARPLTDEDRLHLFAPTYFHEEPETNRDYYGGLFKYAAVISSIKFYIMWQFSRYAGRYGKPIRIGKYPEHASDEDIKVLKDAAYDLGEDLGAVFPQNMDLELAEASNTSSNTNMFETIMHRLDGYVTKLYLGATLPTTAEKYGTRAQSDSQDNVRDDYFEIDLERNETGLQLILDRWWYLNFSRTEPCPLYVQNDYKKPEDLVKLSGMITNLKNAGAGHRIPARYINEKFDIPEPDEDEETLNSGPDRML